jgi:carbamoyltransferase
MVILGIHGGVTVNQHDAGAALIIDGKLVVSVEEERLIRIKTASGTLPIESISACLREAKLRIEDVDIICLPGETYADIIPRTVEWLLHHFGHAPKLEVFNHHTAHLASAFFPSGFDDAMCLSVDAYGDGLSGAVAIGNSKFGLNILETFPASNSLGVFYATMTSFLGFRPGEDEYKVMGLAPYGTPNIDLSFFCKPTSEGFYSDKNYFRTRKNATSLEPSYSKLLIDMLGEPRHKGDPISIHHKNLAASIQLTLEKCLVSLITKAHVNTGKRSLCYAGGVALNCSANKVISELPFIDRFFVQPAATDRGLALGCALLAAFNHGEKIQPIPHVFFGPSYAASEVEAALDLSRVSAKFVDDPARVAARKIASGEIIGWYQGRSEFGPRALGHRSILASPTIPNMKDQINSRIKFREEFRPFAPSVLEEKSIDLFEMQTASPFMTIAYDVKSPWNIKMPATTHINNTGRVQTVNKSIDPMYHQLIENLEEQNGCPAVLNTSFNIKGQPIVEKPLEAISTFFGTGMDSLILGNYLLEKKKNE